MDLTEFVLSNEILLRLGFFFGVFGTMALWERVAPRRKLSVSRPVRWLNNLGLTFFNALLLRWLFPAAAVGMAVFAIEQGWGLFNYYSPPFWLAVAASVLILDFIIWLQHVMFHAVPTLWRLHRVHHADLDFDITTGVRFHPLEMVLSMLIKFAAIGVLGSPVVAVILFEILLNATSMFNHSNVRLPARLDQILRWFLVTPDMHRVHHSVEDDETNSNFGFNLPWWDRLLGTYRDQPRAGHETMGIGIHTFRDLRHCAWLPGMLWLPFIGRIADYAINRRQWNNNND
ncbi:fatty acid hydroxylase [Nitrosococcus halophilus Nc 4]|uniref:Fatty acid hydroxylase n=1 Tax=Nitrosococcus halophilus (strain Nc4) TaxID=472759 RepID=D5C2E0_NITHN|nr:sterol desaturase family protein [Nitrosococcus halophilus]ADE14799.1 fatty acid hydroxylase [Nitrosococcus halophilus Nc 4]